MSQLTNNTTSLQAILEIVNALPEAGGTVKTASGTGTWANYTYAVDGLEFTPIAVFVTKANYTTINTVVGVSAIVDGDGTVIANRTYEGSSTITISEGGFSVYWVRSGTGSAPWLAVGV